MNKSEIIDLLKSGKCEVEFTKVNGENRVMTCTLNESYLPPQQQTESNRKENDDVVSVWCTELGSWRSFKISKLISINQLA